MSFAQTLVVLARLQLDCEFRRAIIADPAVALRASGLSAEELRGLCLLPAETVARIGMMADEHRVLRIAEHIPWFDLQLRPELAPLFTGYTASTPPQLLNRLEAIAFCLYLENLGVGHPPYLPELARYERLRIALSWGLGPTADAVAAGAHSEDFSYPIAQLRAALSAAGWPSAIITPQRLVFRKVPGLPAVLVRAG